MKKTLNSERADERTRVPEASRVTAISRGYIEEWYAERHPDDRGWDLYSPLELPSGVRSFRSCGCPFSVGPTFSVTAIQKNENDEERLARLRKEMRDRLMCVVIP